MQMKAFVFAAVIGTIAAPEAFANHRGHVGGGYPGFCDGGDTIAQCMFARNHSDDFWDRWSFVSCEEARQMLRNRGYSKIKTVSCKGATYVFKAHWKGNSYQLKVARRDGALRSAKKV